jgi:hypothetical protein
VLSFAMVLVIAFLLLVSLVLSAGLAALGQFLGGVLPVPELVLHVINFVVSFAIITVLFAMIFKVLPDAQIAWRDVWTGAAVTALLFGIGKVAIGLYLGHSGTSSTYGAAGSLVVLLLWVYYSAQILFFGAEFTQLYANRFGSKVRPAPDATSVAEAMRSKDLEPQSEHTDTPAAGREPATAGRGGGTPRRAESGRAALSRDEQPSRVGAPPLPSPGRRPSFVAVVVASLIAAALGAIRFLRGPQGGTSAGTG